MRKILSTPLANFALAILCISLFFIAPKLMAAFVDPLIPMVICGIGFFYFGRKMIENFE